VSRDLIGERKLQQRKLNTNEKSSFNLEQEKRSREKKKGESSGGTERVLSVWEHSLEGRGDVGNQEKGGSIQMPGQRGRAQAKPVMSEREIEAIRGIKQRGPVSNSTWEKKRAGITKAKTRPRKEEGSQNESRLKRGREASQSTHRREIEVKPNISDLGGNFCAQSAGEKERAGADRHLRKGSSLTYCVWGLGNVDNERDSKKDLEGRGEKWTSSLRGSLTPGREKKKEFTFRDNVGKEKIEGKKRETSEEEKGAT